MHDPALTFDFPILNLENREQGSRVGQRNVGHYLLLEECMHRIRCSEIWGGIMEVNGEICTSGVTASLYSRSCVGGKGGDIHYLSVCDSDLLTRIAIADVMGHGETVSTLSQWVYEAVAEEMNSLAGNHLLVKLNERIIQRGLEAMTTAAVFAYYLSNSSLYFSYAGHPPQMIRKHHQRGWETACLRTSTGPANLPLGVMARVPYDQAQIPFTTGDRIFLFTDGVIEAPNADGEEFGRDRLLAILNEAENGDQTKLKDTVLTALQSHTGGSFSHDDVTLMLIEAR